jgi:transglutaminase-like putative cysteine protease
LDPIWAIGAAALLLAGGIITCLPLYALPATRSLARGRRPGIEELTLEEAAARLQASGETGRDLVEAARELVANRMEYCRRNSFDSPARAFDRGYGFCTQQAYALADLLRLLGLEAKVVHAFRNDFPDGTVGGHSWVRATVDGEERDVDSIFFDEGIRRVTFASLSRVRNHTPLFTRVTRWGEAALNAHRYYRTGKDM